MESVADLCIPSFISKARETFTSKVVFLYSKHSRIVTVAPLGTPKSVFESETLCCNHGTDSQVVSADASPDGQCVAVSCLSGRGYIFPMTVNSSLGPLELGNDVVAVAFLNNAEIVIANNQSFLYRISARNPAARTQIAVVHGASINFLECVSSQVFISATNGLFILRWKNCMEKVLNMNCYSSTVARPFVYVMSSDGVYRYNFEDESAVPVLLINIVDVVNALSDQIDTNAHIHYWDGSIIVYSKRSVVAFSVEDGLRKASLYMDTRIRGVTVSDGGELLLYTSSQLFALSYPEKSASGSDSNKDLVFQLKKLYESGNASLQFVETATILQKNRNLGPVLLPLLIEQYATLPNSLITEMTPLLVHHIATTKCVSLEELYNALLRYGKQGEIWRLLPAYDVQNQSFCLKHCDDFRISQEAARAILQYTDPRDIPIARLLTKYPDLAGDICRATKECSDPLVLFYLQQFSPQQIRDIHDAASGTGSLVESATNPPDSPLDISQLRDPYFLLDQAKRNGESELASKLAQHISRAQSTSSPTPSTTSGAACMDLAKSLANAAPDETFSNFATTAKTLAQTLNAEASQIETQKRETSAIISDLVSKIHESKQPPRVTPTDKCSKCHRILHKGKIIVYSCGHKFHLQCKDAIFSELEQILMSLKRPRTELADGCPICGVPSALLVHKPLTAGYNNAWSLDFA